MILTSYKPNDSLKDGESYMEPAVKPALVVGMAVTWIDESEVVPGNRDILQRLVTDYGTTGLTVRAVKPRSGTIVTLAKDGVGIPYQSRGDEKRDKLQAEFNSYDPGMKE